MQTRKKVVLAGVLGVVVSLSSAATVTNPRPSVPFNYTVNFTIQ